MTDTMLDFESLSRPMILSNGDSARVRRADPIQSHMAADKSARGLSKLRVAILRLMFTVDGSLVGSVLNTVYHQWSESQPDVYPRCHPDSPRKRAGELADDGFLDVIGTRTGEFGSPESVYRLSPEGRRFIETVDGK